MKMEKLAEKKEGKEGYQYDLKKKKNEKTRLKTRK